MMRLSRYAEVQPSIHNTWRHRYGWSNAEAQQCFNYKRFYERSTTKPGNFHSGPKLAFQAKVRSYKLTKFHVKRLDRRCHSHDQLLKSNLPRQRHIDVPYPVDVGTGRPPQRQNYYHIYYDMDLDAELAFLARPRSDARPDFRRLPPGVPVFPGKDKEAAQRQGRPKIAH
eukprot:1195974-Prorocentrum_minimum.AAC.1